MAKSRRRSAVPERPWEGAQRDENVDGLFAGMHNQASVELNRTDLVFGGNERVIGLPLPGLALRYLLQSTVMPLARIWQITGEEGSCKSAFLFEIMRWHHVYGGGSIFLDNENKDSPELRYGILQWNPAYLRRHERVPTYLLEEWQEALLRFVNIAKAQQAHKDGPGYTIPICFGLDSIMATPPREVYDKLMLAGHASRDHPLAARLISDYMKGMPMTMKNYPFSIVGTNHLKPGTDRQGRPTAQIPGGKSVKFYETFEIEMHRAMAPDIDRAAEAGIRLRMVARKNAVGPSRRQIVVELLWRHEQTPDGGRRQYRGWDWATAAVDLLLSFEKMSGKKTLYNQLMDVCPIRPVSRTTRRAKCEPLGFTKDEPGTYRQIGQALEQRTDLLEQLYLLLGINDHVLFQPGMDYRQALESRDPATARQVVTLYGNVEDLPLLDADALDPTGSTVLPEADDGGE